MRHLSVTDPENTATPDGTLPLYPLRRRFGRVVRPLGKMDPHEWTNLSNNPESWVAALKAKLMKHESVLQIPERRRIRTGDETGCLRKKDSLRAWLGRRVMFANRRFVTPEDSDGSWNQAEQIRSGQTAKDFVDAKDDGDDGEMSGWNAGRAGCASGLRRRNTDRRNLRINERYLVHGLDRDPQKVVAARRNIQARGLYGAVSVDVWEGKTLPYTDNLVNLIIAEESATVDMQELMRVLAPHGVALVKQAGSWTKKVKAWPREMGQWTHSRQGPGNNPVTPDTLVGPPRGLQWSCEPLWLRSHAFTSSFTAMVSAQGRVFYILDEAPTGIAQDAVPEQWTLIARDAFNGILLWKQPLSPWGVKAWKKLGLRVAPLAGTDCLVAHKDRVMMTLGYQSAVSILDAATGRTLGVCEGTDGALELRCENDILVVNRAGESLMAFDARDARPLWKVDARIFNMMINSERVMYFDQTIKALVCLRLEDGTSLWQNPAVRPKSIMTHGDYVVLGPDLQVLSVETGKVLWTKK